MLAGYVEHGGAGALEECLRLGEGLDWVPLAIERARQLREQKLAEPVSKKDELLGYLGGRATKPTPLKARSEKPQPGVPVRSWSDVTAKGIDLEALTYVPGLVGDITEWIIAGARRPNRIMALGVATVAVGTLIGRYVMGPTESATHLFLIILAPTGYGKDHPLQCGVKLMEALRRQDLLGPQEWASAPGFINRLERNPLMVCFMDELGDELRLVNSQSGNEFVRKIIGLLKKCYNAWATIVTAEKVNKESETIQWPAPSIVGAATPESFFEALTPRDLESGFANRLLILPFEGFRRPVERDAGQTEPPKSLVEGLKRLPAVPHILDRPIGGPPPRLKVEWGAGASEIYFEFSQKMDDLEHANRQHYELGMRACENAVRLATIVAVGRGSKTVGREDMEWAVALSERSFQAAIGGIEKYTREYFEFPKFCERIVENIRAAGGWMSKRDLYRKFGRNMRWGNELDRTLGQLVAAERITLSNRWSPNGGPNSPGYQVEEDTGLAAA
jgi:hypothetical protein